MPHVTETLSSSLPPLTVVVVVHHNMAIIMCVRPFRPTLHIMCMRITNGIDDRNLFLHTCALSETGPPPYLPFFVDTFFFLFKF